MFSIETGWPPPPVVGDGHHDERDRARRSPSRASLERFEVDVALEGVHRAADRGPRRIGRSTASAPVDLDVGAGRVEVGVVRDDVARAAERRGQDALGRPPLVGGDHVLEADDVLHRVLEADKAGAAGVGLVAAHHGRPLLALMAPVPLSVRGR